MDPWNDDSHVGPPSEQIIVSVFLDQAEQHGLLHGESSRNSISDRWLALPDAERVAVESECNIEDLDDHIADIFTKPAARASLGTWHHEAMMNVFESNVLSLDKDCKEWLKKASAERETRKEALDGNSASTRQDVIRRELECVPLTCWTYDTDAVHYATRPSVESVNNLVEIKEGCYSKAPVSAMDDVIISVSVFRHKLSRPSLRLGGQHTFLASQTLGDLMDVVACVSNDIPAEVVDEQGQISQYAADVKMDAGACIAGFEAAPKSGEEGVLGLTRGAFRGHMPHLVDGWVFGDGTTDEDYASQYEKWIQSLDSGAAPKGHLRRGTTDLADTPFHALALRINLPYLLIHQGNCHHYIVIDEIRLRQPADSPASRFPLTQFTAIVQRPSCRICAKWPATMSVVGDVRLGETPCMVCTKCWEKLGEPAAGEDILIIPLTAGEMA